MSVECVHIEFTTGSIIVHFLVDKQVIDIKRHHWHGSVKETEPNTYNIDAEWIKTCKYDQLIISIKYYF